MPLSQECQPSDIHDNAAAWLNLSHELRTPTNAIVGHVELLLSGSAGPLSSEMRASLGDIQHAAASLTARIGEIIRLAENSPAPISATVGAEREAANTQAD